MATYGGDCCGPVKLACPDDSIYAIVGADIVCHETGGVIGLAAITIVDMDRYLNGDKMTRKINNERQWPPEYKIMKYLAPGGHALCGIEVVMAMSGEASPGLRQLRLMALPLQNKSVDPVFSDYIPKTAGPGRLTSRLLTCCEGSVNYFVQSIGTAIVCLDHQSLVGALSIACSDFSEVFNPSADKIMSCCLNTPPRDGIAKCWGYTPGRSRCDRFMTSYCYGRPSYECGCVNSPVGVPQCLDARCADQPRAYRTRSMYDDCSNVQVTCDDMRALGGGQYLARGLTPPSGCGAGGGNSNTILLVAIIIIVAVVAIGLANTPTGSSNSLHFPSLSAMEADAGSGL